MRTLILATNVTLLTTAAVMAQDSTQTSVDWPGRYVGVMPCASCPGIDTALTINEAGFYTLDETYREEKDGTFQSEGEFAWDKAGRTIQLKGKDEQRVFLIGKGMAWMVGSDGKPDDNHPLTKLDEFNGSGAQLYVWPDSVVAKDGKASFEGLMNFDHEAEGGHRSLSATFVIDCVKGEIDMPKVSYFAQTDAKGEALHTQENNAGNSAPIPQDSYDVTAQAMAAYCPAWGRTASPRRAY